MDGRIIDLVVIALYLGGTVALAARFIRRSGTAESFSLGSGTIPSWAIGISVLGTFVSSISFVGNPGKAYSDNWAPLGFALMTPLVGAIAAHYFVPIYRSRGLISAYAFLEERLGYWARAYGSASFLVIMLGRVSVILYLVAIIVAPLMDLSISTVIVITGLIVTAYTLMGGMEAVIWTDVVQVVVMIAGALWCLIEILRLMPEGPMQAYAIAAQAGGKFDLGEYRLSWSGQTVLGVMLFAITSNLQNFGTDQNYVQRYLTVSTDRAAKRVVLLGTLPFIPLTALFLMIGTALFSFYRVHPELLPAGATGDMVFPHFIRTQLPAGISGLLVAAILAAAMSTLSSNINCMATVFVEDFWKRRFPGLTPRTHIRILRGFTAFWGTAGTLLGLTMMGYRSGLDRFWEIASIAGSGLLAMFLLAVIGRPARILPLQLAAIAVVLLVLTARIAYGVDALLAGAAGTAVLVAFGMLFCRPSAGKAPA